MYAGSPQEMDEWMSILRWKLVSETFITLCSYLKSINSSGMFTTDSLTR